MKLFLVFLLFSHNAYSQHVCGKATKGVSFNKDCLPVVKKGSKDYPKKLVFLINQWHPSAKVRTTDIEKGKKIPQYKNQHDIYLKAKSLIKGWGSSVVLAEGCEGIIDKKFKKSFYGWDYKKLEKQLKNKDYEHIMAHAPTKLEVEYKDKLDVICSDNEKMMKEHALAFSELRGFTGFLVRLLEYEKKNPELYKKYEKAMREEHKFPANYDAISYAYRQGKENLLKVEYFLKERNNIFFKNIKKHLDKKPIVILGALHQRDLMRRLDIQKIPYVLINPRGFNIRDIDLFEVLKSSYAIKPKKKDK